MNEFNVARAPTPENWKVLCLSLKSIAQDLEELDFKPSLKQQQAIFDLMSVNAKNIYARELVPPKLEGKQQDAV